MLNKLIWNDIRQNKLLSAATVFFMAVSAMMLSLTALLCFSLFGSVNGLMEQARVPDLVQMHSGAEEQDGKADISGGCWHSQHRTALTLAENGISHPYITLSSPGTSISQNWV